MYALNIRGDSLQILGVVSVHLSLVLCHTNSPCFGLFGLMSSYLIEGVFEVWPFSAPELCHGLVSREWAGAIMDSARLFFEFQGSLFIIVWSSLVLKNHCSIHDVWFFRSFNRANWCMLHHVGWNWKSTYFFSLKKKLHNMVCSSRSASFFVTWTHHNIVPTLMGLWIDSSLQLKTVWEYLQWK